MRRRRENSDRVNFKSMLLLLLKQRSSHLSTMKNPFFIFLYDTMRIKDAQCRFKKRCRLRILLVPSGRFEASSYRSSKLTFS